MMTITKTDNQIATVEFVQLRKKFKDVIITTTTNEMIATDEEGVEHVINSRKTANFKITFDNFFKKQMLFTQEKGLNHYLYVTINGIRYSTNAIIEGMLFPKDSNTFEARFIVTTKMIAI